MRILLITLIVLFSLPKMHAETFEQQFSKQASLFLNSLNDVQRSKCIQDYGNDRWQMRYTGGKRAGLQIKELNADQKKILEATLKLVLSDEGWKLANEVAKQEGPIAMDQYYVACFGTPEKGDYAFRLAEHHLTIVNLVIKDNKTKEFGPILLGSNPPEIWTADEQHLIDFYDTMQSPIVKKSSIASKKMPANEGQKYAFLKPSSKAAFQKMWDHRLRIFTPAIQEKINTLVNATGGFEKSKLSFYNEVPEKYCKDGGRWDFKWSNGTVQLDYEGSRGHIHMSLWAKE